MNSKRHDYLLIMVVHAEFHKQQKILVFKAGKPKEKSKEKSNQRKIVTIKNGERAKEDTEGEN